MEPVAIGIICTVVFGTVMSLSVYIRQLFLSRDVRLNEKAHQRALKQEAKELEKLRKQMEGNKRFDSHYKVLVANKEDIQYLDQKIEEILNKKFELIQRYSNMTLKESDALVNGESQGNRKQVSDMLRDEIEREMAFYDEQLNLFQKRRASFWDTHLELQEYLLEQEKTRNTKLDDIYQRHSSMLEKIYIRHNENSELVMIKSIDSATQAFKLIVAPLKYIMQFFTRSSNISLEKVQEEIDSRMAVKDVEDDINGSIPDADEYTREYAFEALKVEP